MSCSLPSRIASLSLWVNLYPPERTRERIRLAALLGKSGRLTGITLPHEGEPRASGIYTATFQPTLHQSRRVNGGWLAFHGRSGRFS